MFYFFQSEQLLEIGWWCGAMWSWGMWFFYLFFSQRCIWCEFALSLPVTTVWESERESEKIKVCFFKVMQLGPVSAKGWPGNGAVLRAAMTGDAPPSDTGQLCSGSAWNYPPGAAVSTQYCSLPTAALHPPITALSLCLMFAAVKHYFPFLYLK